MNVNNPESKEDVLKILTIYLNKNEEKINYYENKIKALETNEEIVNLKERIKTLEKKLAAARSKANFILTEDEETAINEWIAKHNWDKHRYSTSGVIGGRFTYEFIPTSIGTFGTIKCSCGEEFEFRGV